VEGHFHSSPGAVCWLAQSIRKEGELRPITRSVWNALKFGTVKDPGVRVQIEIETTTRATNSATFWLAKISSKIILQKKNLIRSAGSTLKGSKLIASCASKEYQVCSELDVRRIARRYCD
jgi:hypothetical protein